MKYIETKDAGRKKYGAFANARMTDIANRSNFPEHVEIKSRAIQAVVSTLNPNARVFNSARKTMITVKVEGGFVGDEPLFKKCIAEWEDEGIVCKLSAQGININVPITY